MSLRRVGIVFVAAVLGMAMGPRDASAVNSCTITGNPGPLLIDAGHPFYTETACPSSDPCGCTVSGTNCVFKLSTNKSTSSTATCLTLGSGVTFDMDGHSLTCTGSDCGKAVYNTSSGGSSSKVVVKNGAVYGCFDAGFYFDASGGSNTDSSISDVLVDLGSSCTNGITYSNGDHFNVGIAHPKGLMARVSVRNTDIGVDGQTSEDIEDSALIDNVNGMISSFASVDNVLFANNTYHMWEWKGTYDPDIAGSSFIGASTCNCATTPSGVSNAESCQADLTYCGTFVSPPSPVCQPSDTADFCTIEQ